MVPDEWLGAVFESTDEARLAETEDDDEHLSPGGRVVEVLSQHLCQGWLDGYLLTGRHGLFRLLRGVRSHRPELPTDIACLRQDHNGASHQDPGFIDHVANKRPEVVRAYGPYPAGRSALTDDATIAIG